MNTVENWILSKTNDKDVNILPKPTTYKEAFWVLARHFLPSDWYSVNPMPQCQVNTEMIADIITSCESYRFKQYSWWKRLCLKIHCKFTNTPIWKFY